MPEIRIEFTSASKYNDDRRRSKPKNVFNDSSYNAGVREPSKPNQRKVHKEERPWEKRKPFEKEESDPKREKRIEDWLDDAQTLPPEHDGYQTLASPERDRTFALPQRGRTFPDVRGPNAYALPQIYDDRAPGRYERQEIPGPSPEEIDIRAYNNYQAEIQRWYADNTVYKGSSRIAEWPELPHLKRVELRSIAKEQILAERFLASDVPVRDTPKISQNLGGRFNQEIPFRPQPKRSSSVYDKTRNPPPERSQKSDLPRKSGLKDGQRQEKIEPSFVDIESKARKIYDNVIENEKINNRERYVQQKMLGYSPITWDQLDETTIKDYRDDAYNEILAERNASHQEKTASARPRQTTRDAYQKEEYDKRPPVTRKSTRPKRSSSMSSAYGNSTRPREKFIATPIKTQEQNTREYHRQMEAERKSLTRQFLSEADKDWKASGGHGDQKELKRIQRYIERTPWQEIKPENRRNTYEDIMNDYAQRYNNKPINGWQLD